MQFWNSFYCNLLELFDIRIPQPNITHNASSFIQALLQWLWDPNALGELSLRMVKKDIITLLLIFVSIF